MRASLFLLKWSRAPQNEAKVPFKPDLPLKLRNHVTGKGDKNKEKGCLYEISLVLACLDKNNFEDKMCRKEIDNFQNCYTTYLSNKKFAKAEALRGSLTPGAKNLKYKQINQLLKKYPQVN